MQQTHSLLRFYSVFRILFYFELDIFKTLKNLLIEFLLL